MLRSHSWAVFVALAVLGVAAGAGGVTAMQADHGVPDSDRQVETPTDENETQQENPESVDDGEYSDETSAWLARRMSAQLENSSIALSNQQYEQARAFLGDEYDERLAQYVEVAGDTSRESDDTTAREFKTARNNQRNFTNKVQRYRQQYIEYQNARQNGNEREARVTAREMQRTTSNVTDSQRALNKNFNQIENNSNVDLSKGLTEVNKTTENITATQTEVREATFLQTTLTVQATASTASFSEPGTVTGQIQTENGTVIANRAVTLRIENQTQTVRTDPKGAFELEYRPRSARLNEQSVKVEYLPNSDSAYLSDNDTFTIDVQQVRPDVTSEITPNTVGYGDSLNVSASARAASTGVEGIPIEFLVGDTVLVQTTTGPNGSATTSVRVPATVDNGDRRIIARIPYEGRAIAGERSIASISVVETQTDLSVTASRQEEEILVGGRLQTVGGKPITDRLVRLRVGTGETQVVETAQNGSFQTAVSNPQDRGAVTITVLHDGSNSNLGNATATATVSTGSGGGDPPVGGDGDQSNFIDRVLELLFGSEQNPGFGYGSGIIGFRWLPIIGGVTALSVVGGVWIVVSRLREETETEAPVREEPIDTSTPVIDRSELQDSGSDFSFEERVETYLDSEDYDRAVSLAYEAVHDELTVKYGIEASMTHWELLRKSQQHDVLNEHVGDIETVVRAFETAAFAPTSVDPSHAEAAIDRARKIRSNVAA